MEFNWVCNVWVMNKIGRPQSGRMICWLQVWLQVELDNTKSLQMNHNHYNFWRQQIRIGQISSLEEMSQVKNSLILEIPQLFFFFSFFFLDKWLLLWLLRTILWLVDLVYRTKYDWLLQLSDYSSDYTLQSD